MEIELWLNIRFISYMKNLLAPLSLIATLSLLSCNSTTVNQEKSQDTLASAIPNQAHTSENSLDWAGIYQDTIPCADCPGINTTIEINKDNTFKYNAEYLERNSTLVDSGSFEWINNGRIIHLKGKTIESRYKVGENILIPTDSLGNNLEGANAQLLNLKKIK